MIFLNQTYPKVRQKHRIQTKKPFPPTSFQWKSNVFSPRLFEPSNNSNLNNSFSLYFLRSIKHCNFTPDISVELPISRTDSIFVYLESAGNRDSTVFIFLSYCESNHKLTAPEHVVYCFVFLEPIRCQLWVSIYQARGLVAQDDTGMNGK